MATHPEGEFDYMEAQQGYGEAPSHSSDISDGYGSSKTTMELAKEENGLFHTLGVEVEI